MAALPTAVATPPRRPLDWREATDWYIPEDLDGKVVVLYPGAVRADDNLMAHARELHTNAVWHCSQQTPPPVDWQMEYQGIQFRVHRQHTVDGTVFMLRKIASEPPVLDRLGLPLEIDRLLRRANFAENGGLVLVTGGPGHGKSTTCAAIVYERVKAYGFFCLTVENPVEFPMHREYEATNGRIGQIIQVPARTESFSHDLKDALRCYPSNMKGSMLMVGEVREGNAAAQLLRAAVNGQLVFTTLHAGDPVGALERVISMARAEMGQDEARSLLAHSLRAVLHQRILNGRLEMQVLLSLSSTSSVAARIKNGALPQLSSDMEAQRTALANGRLLETLLSAARIGG